MRKRKVFTFLALLLIMSFMLGISRMHTLRPDTLPATDSAGTAVSLLEASADTFFPGIGGYNVSDYEYFGIWICLDDAGDDAIDVDVTIQHSGDGTNWEEYTQTCIYPAIEAATATLNINDEDCHGASLHIGPQPWIRIVLDNNNADADVTPTVILNVQ